MTTQKLRTFQNTQMTLRYVDVGEQYGLDGCLTADKPMIEFYLDGVRNHDLDWLGIEHQYFITRYYAEQIIALPSGLCLDGGRPEYNLDASDVGHVARFIHRAEMGELR